MLQICAACVLPIYLVPRDLPVPTSRVAYHIAVVEDARRWYGRATGGFTFRPEPLVVQISRHTFAELAADNFQAWWPLLQAEFADYGYAWNHHAKIKLAFLTHGAGAWAGADSENGGLGAIADAGKTDHGNQGGLAVIGDSSVGGVLAGVCPETSRGKSDSTEATAWWCSGSTYRGTLAHELGHTFGLPHPDAFRPGFRCADSTAYSLMQCHWEWRRDALLPYEVAHLKSLDFFHPDTTTPYTLLAPLGATLTWLDGRGGGTGYPWATTLGPPLTRDIPPGRSWLEFDAGIARGEQGSAELLVSVDGRPVALVTLQTGAPPQRIVLPVSGKSLTLRRRSGPPLVLGNPRLR